MNFYLIFSSRGSCVKFLVNPDIPANIRSKFQKTWAPKIIKYAEGRNKLSKYIDSMKATVDDETGSYNISGKKEPFYHNK